MLAGSCRWRTIGNKQYRMLQVVRKAFYIVEVWKPACCHGNKVVSSYCRAALKNQTFLIKIDWDILVCHIWSKFGGVYDVITWLICIFKNLNISGTKRDIWKQWTAFYPYAYQRHVYILKSLRFERCDFRHSTTLT